MGRLLSNNIGAPKRAIRPGWKPDGETLVGFFEIHVPGE